MLRLPRNAQIWFPAYLQSRLSSLSRPAPARLWVTITDHYEPLWRGADESLARDRVARWVRAWPEIARRHHDQRGHPPKYCFFYPEDEYRPFLLDPLAGLTEAGVADVEIHIHHDDGPRGAVGRQHFLERMEGFIETLTSRHGLLHRRDGRMQFGFIHGNWALDNSRPDGRWCGINDEISLLARLGCYADFTLPSAPHPTQARMVNVIYWAVDDPARPKSYDRGIPLRPGCGREGDLLLIPGPFGLRWAERFLPRLEGGELAHYDPPSRYRVVRWMALAPRLGSDCFLKLYTHGAQEKNRQMLLEGGLDELFAGLGAVCRERNCQLYFVSAWQMYLAVEAIRAGGDPVAAVQKG